MKDKVLREVASAVACRAMERTASNGGPFEGAGWSEQSKWLQEAIRSTPQKVTPQRAKEIIQQAKA